MPSTILSKNYNKATTWSSSEEAFDNTLFMNPQMHYHGTPDESSWSCPACEGPVVPLGKLGNVEHGRCRNCGADSSRSGDMEDDFEESVEELLGEEDGENAGYNSEARELENYINNHRGLYDRQYKPIIKNLRTKQARGVYDSELAVKGFMYLVDAAAKEYAREHGGGTFDRQTKLEVARSLVASFEGESELGNYDNDDFLPKKYQMKRNESVKFPKPKEGEFSGKPRGKNLTKSRNKSFSRKNNKKFYGSAGESRSVLTRINRELRAEAAKKAKKGKPSGKPVEFGGNGHGGAKKEKGNKALCCENLDMQRVMDAAQEGMFGNSYVGFCKACGEETSGVEPDARNYHCESCGADEVFGAEELLFTLG